MRTYEIGRQLIILRPTDTLASVAASLALNERDAGEQATRTPGIATLPIERLDQIDRRTDAGTPISYLVVKGVRPGLAGISLYRDQLGDLMQPSPNFIVAALVKKRPRECEASQP